MFGKNETKKPLWLKKADGQPAMQESLANGEDLIVHSIFGTIQGEGPFAGQPAIFVRLTGCNLRCWFCDTEFDKQANIMSVASVISSIQTAMEEVETDLIVLTGGEPMRQQIIPFLHQAVMRGWLVQIETAGTVWPEMATVRTKHSEHMAPTSLMAWKPMRLEDLLGDEGVTLVCSPKTPKLHPLVAELCRHFKYIIRKGDTADDGLPAMSTQDPQRRSPAWRPWRDGSGFDATKTIWLQPMMEYDEVQQPDDALTLANAREAARLAMKHGYRLSIQIHKPLGLE